MGCGAPFVAPASPILASTTTSTGGGAFLEGCAGVFVEGLLELLLQGAFELIVALLSGL